MLPNKKHIFSLIRNIFVPEIPNLSIVSIFIVESMLSSNHLKQKAIVMKEYNKFDIVNERLSC